MCASAGRAGEARETWLILGRTYENVRVREVTPSTVTIFHRGGIVQLELAKLPADMQQRFGYDAGAAAAWEAEQKAASAARSLALVAPEPAPPPPPEDAATAPPGSPGAAGPAITYHEEVDLRPACQEMGFFLKDQGRRPSCAVFALVSALEFEIARHGGRPEPLSEEFLVWAVRELQPGIPVDDGYHFPEVVAALQTYGVPRLDLMPNTFGRKIEDIRPTPAALSDALSRRSAVPVWFRPGDPMIIDRLVDTLNRGSPVIVGLRWPHWRTLDQTTLLSEQKPLDGSGHAVTLVGYRCPEGRATETVFVFRNSYGASWGAGGCGHVTAAYLREHLLAAFHVTLPREPATTL